MRRNSLILLTLLVFAQPAWSAKYLNTAKDKLLNYLFGFSKTDSHVGVQTDALLVWKDGKVIVEKYARGYRSDTKHYLWSMSKAITGTLVGIAVQQGKLSLSDSIGKFLPDISEEQKKIQIRHLMEWTSGLDWLEVYEKGRKRTESSVANMLYHKGAKDMAGYILSHSAVHEPGSRYNYSSGDSTLLMAVLAKVWSEDKYFPWTQLFDPLGIEAVFERDSKGVFAGSSLAHMTARNLLKFARLWIGGGELNGQRFFSKEFLEFSWTESSGKRKKSKKKSPSFPLRQWWTYKNTELPEDAVFALGHWKQSMMIVPSQNLIAIRFADDRDGTYKVEKYLSLLMEFLDEEI